MDVCLISEWSAVAILRGDSNVKGTVTFEQASEGAPTTVSYDITGSDPSAEVWFHGSVIVAPSALCSALVSREN